MKASFSEKNGPMLYLSSRRQRIAVATPARQKRDKSATAARNERQKTTLYNYYLN
jgi:hypothetical protein